MVSEEYASILARFQVERRSAKVPVSLYAQPVPLTSRERAWADWGGMTVHVGAGILGWLVLLACWFAVGKHAHDTDNEGLGIALALFVSLGGTLSLFLLPSAIVKGCMGIWGLKKDQLWGPKTYAHSAVPLQVAHEAASTIWAKSISQDSKRTAHRNVREAERLADQETRAWNELCAVEKRVAQGDTSMEAVALMKALREEHNGLFDQVAALAAALVVLARQEERAHLAREQRASEERSVDSGQVDRPAGVESLLRLAEDRHAEGEAHVEVIEGRLR